MHQLRNDLTHYFAMLAKAHDGSVWRVGPGIAATISTSIWLTAMPLGDYNLAEEAMVRFFAHPEPFDRTEWQAFLFTSTVVRDLDSSAWQNLIDLVDSGPIRPRTTARTAYYKLSAWFPPSAESNHDFDSLAVSNGAKALAAKFALIFKTSKKHLRAAEDSKTWDNFGRSLAFSIGLPPLDANGRAQLAPMPNPPE